MADAKEVRLPDIGDFDNVPVIEILVAAGDSVEAEQSLVTLESDKATMDVPAPFAGVVKSIEVSEGDEVNEGDLIAMLEAGADTAADGAAADGAAADEAKDSPPPAAEDKPAPAKAPESKPQPDAPAAAPAAAPAPASTPSGPAAAHDASRIMPGKVPYASPAVRQYGP